MGVKLGLSPEGRRATKYERMKKRKRKAKNLSDSVTRRFACLHLAKLSNHEEWKVL
jgi:hypothetical protein